MNSITLDAENCFMKNWAYILLIVLLPLICNAQVTNPAEIAGMQLWLRSDTGVVLDGNQAVQTWQDISGQGRDATNANTVMRPIYPQAAFGPYPSVRFDGVDDFLSFSEIANIRTVFWVIREDPTASNNFRPLLGHSTISDFLRADNGSFWRNTGNPATSANVFVRDGVTRLNQLVINGTTTQVPDQYALVSLVTTGNVTATSFSRSLFGGWVWKGDLVELIIYDTPLTNEQVVDVENYLRQRYAPPVDLGEDINQEYGLCVDLAPNWNYVNYNWSNGSQSSATTVQQSGTYSLTAIDVFGISSTDSLNVFVPYQPFSDSTICYGNEIEWNTGLSEYYSLQWNNGDTSAVLNISDAGMYYAFITDTLFCVLNTDSAIISVDEYSLEVLLGPSDSLCAGNEIYLVDGEDEAISYVWNDGSAEQNLSVFESGDYWVEVINDNGCIGQDTLSITIQGVAPEVQFSIDQYCEQLPVVINDMSVTSDGSNILTTRWIVVGDTLWGEEIVVQFEDYGDYSLSLFVETDAGCNAVLSDSFTIHPRPRVDFNHSVACTNQLTLFEEDSEIPLGAIVSYFWNFGNGTNSNEVQPAVEYDTYGLVTASLTLVSDQGCDSTYSEPLFVNSTPVAEFNWNSACIGTPMEFYHQVDEVINPVVSHTWNFGSGLNSSLENPTFLYSTSGNHLVKHLVHAVVEGQSACFNEYEEFVLVSPLPEISFENTPACVGQTVSFTNTSIPGEGDTLMTQSWTLNGEFLGDAPVVQWLPENQGLVDVWLQIETTSGCLISETQQVLVGITPEPQFSFTPEIGLPPLEVQFTTSDDFGSFWFWVFENSGDSFEQNPMYTFQDTGVFEVTLFIVDEAGCVGESTQEISIIQPVYDAAIEQITCERIGNQIFINVVIGNYGNHNLRSADINYWLANGTQVTDQWEGVLARNSLTQYTFQSALNYNESINADYLCVEIGNINGGGPDSNLANNKMCKAFSEESFEIFDAFPIPAVSSFWLNFNLKNAGQVEFRIYQTDGKLIDYRSDSYASGMNQIEVDVVAYSSGIYIIEGMFKDKVITKRVMVNNTIE